MVSTAALVAESGMGLRGVAVTMKSLCPTQMFVFLELGTNMYIAKLLLVLTVVVIYLYLLDRLVVARTYIKQERARAIVQRPRKAYLLPS